MREQSLPEMRSPGWLISLFWSSELVPAFCRLLLWLAVSQWLAYQHLLPMDDNQRYTLLYLTVIFLTKTFLFGRLEHFPGGRSASYRLALVAGLFAIVFFSILAMRLGYARASLFAGMGLLLVGELVLSLLRERLEMTRYMLIPPVIMPLNVPNNMRFETPQTPDTMVAGVLVVEPDGDITHEWLRFIARASASGRQVISLKQLQEKMTGKVAVNDLAMVELETLVPAWPLLASKRLLDVLIVLLFLPVVVPLGVLIALLVRLDSPGQAIFRQERVGCGNNNFLMYKFRSMRDLPDGAKFANEESDRITRLGYFIRATHLDELPQLFNVLKGDMSLVGPRPEQPQFVADFEQSLPCYRYRHLVRPGVTGWAQVCQGYAADTDTTREKLAYDLFYIKHLSLWLDILILARTLRSILLDRHPGS